MHKRVSLLTVVLALAAISLGFTSNEHPSFAWQLTPTGSDARLRGLAAISADVVWASGSEGTVLRTIDGGQTWQSVGPPGTADLQFRDIEAWGPDRAAILAIGPGDFSRVYVTRDGGQSWSLGFVNDDPNAFYDCMAFFNKKHGLAVSDPVNGAFRVIATDDGGLSWQVVPADMPLALPGEFGFAASGQCLVTVGSHNAWIGSGGGATTRVFHSTDGGTTWTVASTPVRSGPTAGIFALAFRDKRQGLAIGGDFAAPVPAPDGLALTRDGGATWSLVPDADAPNEYRSGVTWRDARTAIAVGPTGSDVSFDRGATWTRFDDGSFDTVDCHEKACWASGEQGRVAFLTQR
jgi:photosystem II stability/assembly factor-like uncharacterized protein